MLRNLPIDWKAIRGNSLFVKNWLRWASIVPKSNWMGTIFVHATARKNVGISYSCSGEMNLNHDLVVNKLSNLYGLELIFGYAGRFKVKWIFSTYGSFEALSLIHI